MVFSFYFTQLTLSVHLVIVSTRFGLKWKCPELPPVVLRPPSLTSGALDVWERSGEERGGNAGRADTVYPRTGAQVSVRPAERSAEVK